MAWVETRITRTSQPQDACGIDWSNPICRGLVRALLCNDKRPIDVAGNAPVTVGRNTYTNGVHIAPQGKAVRAYLSPYGNGQEVTFPGWGSASGEASFVLLQHRVLNTDNNVWIRAGVTSDQHFPWGGRVQASPFWTSRWIDALPPSGKSFLEPHVLSVSVKNGSQKAFWDGRLFASAANSGGFFMPSTVALIQDDLTDMAYYNAMFFNRALSDAEIKSLSDNPWQIFEPEVSRIWVDDYVSAGGGATTGTLAATETGSDTAVLSGQVIVQGTLSATETGQDTAAITGKVIITGTLAAAEIGSDTAAINGSASVTTTGTLAATESGSDTAALTGFVLVQGALSATESGSDAAALAGQVLVQGTLAATEQGSDTALINGSSAITTTGTLDATEQGGDTVAMTGQVLVQALIDAAEQGEDTAQLVGQIVVTGVLAAVEVGGDTAAFYNTAPVIYTPGAQTRPSRLQSSSRPSRIQTGTRASR